ncbi:MAG: flavodoxin family protein [Bilophila wadsworthia]
MISDCEANDESHRHQRKRPQGWEYFSSHQGGFAELEAEGIETDLVQLHGKALEPCKACFGCGEASMRCKTDYFNECFAKMVEADGIVLGSLFIPPMLRQG